MPEDDKYQMEVKLNHGMNKITIAVISLSIIATDGLSAQEDYPLKARH
jgi:hypothetical protein